MEPKGNDNKGCFPLFGNNLLTLFGLMVLDDEDRMRRERKDLLPEDGWHEDDELDDSDE